MRHRLFAELEFLCNSSCLDSCGLDDRPPFLDLGQLQLFVWKKSPARYWQTVDVPRIVQAFDRGGIKPCNEILGCGPGRPTFSPSTRGGCGTGNTQYAIHEIQVP